MGTPNSRISGKKPRKRRDLEQYIILDTRNFFWFQKLKKFRPDENFQKQVFFLFFLQKHSGVNYFDDRGSPDQTTVVRRMASTNGLVSMKQRSEQFYVCNRDASFRLVRTETDSSRQ